MLQLVNISPFNNGDDAAADIAKAAGLHFDGIRTSEEQGWDNWESSLDKYCAAATAHGMFVMQTCQPTDHVMPSTEADIQAYANYAAKAFAKPAVKFVGAGNEWNGFGINRGTTYGWDPVLAGKITVACLQAVQNLPKELTKGKFIVTPEVCPGSGIMNPNNGIWPAYSEPLAWFKAMVDGNPGMLNYPHLAIGWHPYDDPRYPAATWADWNTCIKAFVADQWLKTKYSKSLPFVFGEYGTAIKRNGLTTPQSVGTEAQQQASYLDYQKAFHVFHQAGMNVKATSWFFLNDYTMEDTSDWSACTGLLTLNGTERAICSSVRAKNLA